MNRNTLQNGRSSAILPTLILASVLFLAPSASFIGADAQSIEFIQIRIQEGDETVLFEMPVAVLEFLSEKANEDVHLGRVNGKSIDFPLDKLLQTVENNADSEGEFLFMSVEEKDESPVNFYAKTFVQKAAKTIGPPKSVVLTVHENGEQETKVTLSLAVVDLFATILQNVEPDDDDFAPFIKACLSAVGDLGQGTLVKIVSQSEQVVLRLE